MMNRETAAYRASIPDSRPGQDGGAEMTESIHSAPHTEHHGRLRRVFSILALLFALHCSLITSSCAWFRKSAHPGDESTAQSTTGDDEVRRALVVDFDADPKEREAVHAALKAIRGIEIVEIKGSSLAERTLLYFKPDSKDDAGKLLTRTKGAMAIDSMPWGGPYDLVVFLRSRTTATTKPETPTPPKPQPPPAEVIYYVTAQKYFRVTQHQVAPEGTVTLSIEKSGDSVKSYPKVTLRAMTEDKQVVSEDAIKAESFLTAVVGYREDLKLSFPPEPRVKSLQIEVKAYDDKGSIILN